MSQAISSHDIDISFLNTLVSGPFTLLLTRMQCYPELVKQKLESSSAPKSGVEIAKAILKKEGFLAFWKGNLARILHGISNVSVSVSLVIYMAQANHSSAWTKEIVALVAAGIAYPLKFSEVHLSNNTQPGFKTIRQSIAEGTAKGGFRNIYRGFLLHYLYYACLAPIGLLWQRWTALKLGDSQYAKSAVAANFLAVETLKYGIMTVWKRMVMSSLNQRPYRHTAECVMSMYREGGVTAFYRGYSIFMAYLAFVALGAFTLNGTDSTADGRE